MLPIKKHDMNYLHKHKKKTQQNTSNKTSTTHPDQTRCGKGSPPTHSGLPECLSQYYHTPATPVPKA